MKKITENRNLISGFAVGIFLLALCIFAGANSSANLKSLPVAMPIENRHFLKKADLDSVAEIAMERAEFVELGEAIENFLNRQSGEWSIYVKNLETGDVINISETPIYAASLSKLFVMEYAFAHMDQLRANGYSEDTIMSTLNAMITVSDNDAYNQLISMSSPTGSFVDGCEQINEYLSDAKYENTGIYHTLHPCKSPYLRISRVRNHTTAEDCGKLLEAVYEEECVSEEASEQMMELLLNQERTGKIPAGLPTGTRSANKTGETDEAQHDAAIIFGPETDYIFCVMTYNAPGSITAIQKLSGLIYEYLE